MTPMVQGARAWAQGDNRVFPCGPDKRPLVKDWPNVATTDPDQIAWWWKKWPDALIGAVTGEAFSVLDLDLKGGKDGLRRLLNWAKQGLVKLDGRLGIMVETPTGGLHMLFKADGERSISNWDPFNTRQETGIDVRGAGGYIIGAGSPGYEILLVDPEWALKQTMSEWLGVEVPKVVRPTADDVAKFAHTGSPQGVSTDDNLRPVGANEARAALAHVPADDRDLCVRVGSALKLELGEAGWDVFVEWCSKSEKFNKPDSARRVGAEMCRALWDGCTLTEVRRGTIFWLAEQHGWKAQRPTKAAQKPAEPAAMHFIRLADVQAQQVRWLWVNRFALGKLSLLAGHPGLGKSQITIDIAARVTRGLPWPNGEGRAPQGSVIILSAEDDPADTIRPRMDSAGADPERVFLIEAIREKGSRRGFDLTRDIERLDQLVQEIGNVKLIVIDPISAYLGGKMDSHRNTDVRAALAPLQDLAARHGVAVIAVSHLSKGGSGSAAIRAIGSVAFSAAARAVFLVVQPEDEVAGPRLFLPAKNNLGPDRGTGLGFVIEQRGTATVVAWQSGAVSMTADEALEAKRGGRTDKVGEAEAFLRTALAHGPRWKRELATEGGFSEKVLDAASKRLWVVKEQVRGGWRWRLLTQQEEEEADRLL